MKLRAKVGIAVALSVGVGGAVGTYVYEGKPSGRFSEATQRQEVARCAAHLGTKSQVVAALDKDCEQYYYNFSRKDTENYIVNPADGSSHTTSETQFILPTAQEFTDSVDIYTDQEAIKFNHKMGVIGGVAVGIGASIFSGVGIAAFENRRKYQSQLTQPQATAVA